MLASIKSEFRKLVTVRSTYILSTIALVYMIFYNFYIVGFNVGHHLIYSPSNSHYLMIEVTRASSIAAPILLSSIIAVLLMAHEYRYNTIMYTLTNSNSRNKSIFAKIVAVTGLTVVFSIMIEILSPLLVLFGAHVDHLKLAHQVFYYKDFFGRVLFYGWAYGMIGLLLAVLFRNIVAAIIALFFIPVTIEPLIGLLLSDHMKQYMPFTALTDVLNNGLLVNVPGQLSALRSAVTALVYLAIFWAVAWVLFLRRDAN
jgi:ABC-type transport system involved in multi-copper enzyme maturation permease subunit